MMNREEAGRLVKETFNKPYDKNRFSNFINNLSLPMERLKESHYSGQYIPKNFTDHIASYRRLAKIRASKLKFDVLEIKLKKTSSMENARTMQRGFVARYLDGAFGGTLKDAAFAAFHSEDSDSWRFSLIYKDSIWTENGVQTNFSSARRYSYLVGPHEPTHTAESQLTELLTEELPPPSPATLNRLKEAFAVERVSKEFFNEYKNLFDELSGYVEQALKKRETAQAFKEADLTASIYAKRLLGQIVFLYFLQKKGWLGVKADQKWGQGPRNYLSGLFHETIKKRQPFFTSCLEPLFYEGLAEDRRKNDYFYMPLATRIPFLNGGLFESSQNFDWRASKLDLPDTIFEKILSVFDRYNFTVREDEPLEKEVAIDPEMLGQVFENLLESEARKSSGSFYTPREIVHYMVKESLIRFLDQAVNYQTVFQTHLRQPSLFPYKKPTTLLDEPVRQHQERIKLSDLSQWIHGGGEMSTKDYNPDQDTQMSKDIIEYAQELDSTLAGLKICDPAIGSGAFPVALLLEVVRLRRSLQHKFMKKPQSAYELKRETILNSIYGVDKEISAVDIAKLRLWLSLVVDEDNFDDIKPLPNLDYKIMVANSLVGSKKKYDDLLDYTSRKKITEMKRKFFDTVDLETKKDLHKKINELASKMKVGFSFDWHNDFCEIFQEGKNPGFDIVIGNPPYIPLHKIKEEADRLQKLDYDTFARTGDIYCLFYEQGYYLLAENGILTFITSNSWIKSGYGQKLRDFFVEKTNPQQLIDFVDLKIFKEATVEVNILIFQKTANAMRTQGCLVKDDDSLNNLSVYIEQNSGICRFESGDSWTILSPIEQSIKRKIEAVGVPLKEWGITIYRGVLTGYNEAFIIDGNKRNELIAADQKSDEIIRPILRGRDIKRYGYEFADQWLIATFPSRNYDIERYPAVKNHLLSFGIERLEQTGKTYYQGTKQEFKARKKTNNKWFETQDSIS